MAESLTANRWIYATAYFGVCAVIILARLLPIDLVPGRFPGPDLLICITFAWVLRRPHYVPTLLIAFIFLLTDMLFLRPPGLWTALVVLGVEFLRSREFTLREQSLMAEILTVAAAYVAMALSYRLALAIFLVPQPGIGITALQVLATLIAYPVIVGLSRLVFGVGRLNPVEADAIRRRR